MLYQRLRLSLALAALLALVGMLLTPLSAPAQTAKSQRVFLPLLAGGTPNNSVFGIEMYRLDAQRGIELVTTSGTRWIRRNALLWKEVEPVAGQPYNWDHPEVKYLEGEMIKASQLGVNLVLIVRGSPDWAVAPYTAGCGPINPGHYASFARFMAAAVERYSKPPFNVKYWELGNEPDAPIRPDDFVFGCWGIESDPYYGGRAYGAMLKQVVPAMKAVNPRIAVMNGGLLLDQPYVEGKSANTAGRFFEGMLLAGAGPHMDIISFHTYVFWYTPGQPPIGPRDDWRIAYLRGLLQKYGHPQTPLLRTETALLCVEVTPECRWAQADIVARTYARTLRDGLLGTLWYIYDNDGFHNTGMIEPVEGVFAPRPAYFAYRHAARMLNGASYLGPIPDLPASVEGYRFQRDGELIYTFWTDDPAGVPISLPVPPGTSVTCTERDGGPQACTTEGSALARTAQVSPAFVVVR